MRRAFIHGPHLVINTRASVYGISILLLVCRLVCCPLARPARPPGPQPRSFSCRLLFAARRPYVSVPAAPPPPPPPSLSLLPRARPPSSPRPEASPRQAGRPALIDRVSLVVESSSSSS